MYIHTKIRNCKCTVKIFDSIVNCRSLTVLQKNVVQLIKILQSKISFYEKNINY